MTLHCTAHSTPLLDVPSHRIFKDGRQEWRIRGRLFRWKLHRYDGPARIWAHGIQEWYVDGKSHRDDGPAVVHPDGYQSWCVHGVYHRLDGPAIIYPNGTELWWIDGHEITHLSAHEKLAHIRAYSQKCGRH